VSFGKEKAAVDAPFRSSVLTMVGGQIAYAGGGFARYRNGAPSDIRK
jgi:hypothetical protein